MLTAIYAQSMDGWMADPLGRIPWKNDGIRAEMNFFRQTTLDAVVIMGGKTYAAMCRHGHKLAGRRLQIVVSKTGRSVGRLPFPRDVALVDGVAAALHAAALVGGQAFVIGGPETFRSFGPWLSGIVASVVHRRFGTGDTAGWTRAPDRAFWEAAAGPERALRFAAREPYLGATDPFEVHWIDVVRRAWGDILRFRNWHDAKAAATGQPPLPPPPTTVVTYDRAAPPAVYPF